MNKIILLFAVSFVIAINPSPLLGGEWVAEDSWLQLRELHLKYMGNRQHNDTSYSTTIKWIAQDMLKWVMEGRNALAIIKSKYGNDSTEILELLKRINDQGITIPPDVVDVESFKNLKKTNKELQDKNDNLKKENECCKISMFVSLGVNILILIIFIFCIMVKKCQAKKVPKIIEEIISKK